MKQSIKVEPFVLLGHKLMVQRSITFLIRMGSMSEHDEQELRSEPWWNAEAQLRKLIEGRLSRTAVADWASKWIGNKPGEMDQRTWRLIIQLSGADLISTDRPFFHGREDFEAWHMQYNERAP